MSRNVNKHFQMRLHLDPTHLLLHAAKGLTNRKPRRTVHGGHNSNGSVLRRNDYLLRWHLTHSAASSYTGSSAYYIFCKTLHSLQIRSDTGMSCLLVADTQPRALRIHRAPRSGINFWLCRGTQCPPGAFLLFSRHFQSTIDFAKVPEISTCDLTMPHRLSITPIMVSFEEGHSRRADYQELAPQRMTARTSPQVSWPISGVCRRSSISGCCYP